MTNLDVVINAITTGAGLVASGVASAAARDAYDGLKNVIRPHLAGNDIALAELESEAPCPDVLRDHLAGAMGDPALVGAARACAQVIHSQRQVIHSQRFETKDSPGSVFGPSGPVTVHNTHHYGGVRPLPQSPAAM